MSPAFPLLSSLSAPAERRATLAEVFSETATDGAPTGFVLAHLAPGAQVLWVQDRLSRREGGRPHLPGIIGLPGAPPDLLHLEVSRPADVLWAMEQALGCATLSAVMGEVWGEPPALDFTATKRLALRAERSGTAAWLLRRAAVPSLSAARERWRVVSLPSRPVPDALQAPGEALWRATLFRSRHQVPGEWLAWRDPAHGRLVLARQAGQEAGYGTLSAPHGPRAA